MSCTSALSRNGKSPASLRLDHLTTKAGRFGPKSTLSQMLVHIYEGAGTLNKYNILVDVGIVKGAENLHVGVGNI